MKFGVQFRSMHTGIHGMMIFKEEDRAEKALSILKEIESGNIQDNEEAESLVREINRHLEGEIEEIHFREVEEIMYLSYKTIQDGHISTAEDEKTTIINANQAVDIY